MQWLTDNVALITGAGSGIGEAVVRRFVEEGAKVLAFDISEQRLAALKDEFDGDVAVIRGDVRSLEDNKKAVATAVSEFGKLDVFVGNAGIYDGNRTLVDLSEAEIEQGYEEIFTVNVKGYLLGAKAAVPELLKSRGNIVFTLSTSSFYVGGGGPIYVASKHATAGLMLELAYELAPDIRVNGVAPAGTPTGLQVAPALGRGQGTPQGVSGAPRDQRRSNNPLQITLRPEDHAAAYVLLASSQSRAITGVTINTDAGRGVISTRRPTPEAPAP